MVAGDSLCPPAWAFGDLVGEFANHLGCPMLSRRVHSRHRFAPDPVASWNPPVAVQAWLRIRSAIRSSSS